MEVYKIVDDVRVELSLEFPTNVIPTNDIIEAIEERHRDINVMLDGVTTPLRDVLEYCMVNEVYAVPTVKGESEDLCDHYEASMNPVTIINHDSDFPIIIPISTVLVYKLVSGGNIYSKEYTSSLEALVEATLTNLHKK